MTDETNTPAAGAGTDNVETSSDTSYAEYQYYDPDEDQDNVEDAQAQEPDAEDEAAEPAEPTEPVPDDPDEQAPEAEQADEAAFIELPDGSKVSKDEAVKGYLRQADYTRKAQEVATQRKALHADLQRMEGITQTFADVIAKMMPPEPSPELALTDPQAHYRAKVQYDAALKRVQEIISFGEQVKQVKGTLSEQDQRQLIERENGMLAQRFPATANPQGREQFFQQAAGAATELGYTPEELGNITDHRAFALAYYAALGLKAEKAKAQVKDKVTSKTPPVTPNKPASNGKPARRPLPKTMSLHQAAALGWDD